MIEGNQMNLQRMTLSILMAAMMVAVFLLIFCDKIEAVLLFLLTIRGEFLCYNRKAKGKKPGCF